ncbi:hypothetical protein PoB_001454800 [Plakobranchus ocellatus]|uniref:Uncharacterized protein n=1 Tax=Plakobranchus ocellatus TaxID=259542 RepID=A0AAV3Z0K7_9GAST|nr:hypothetical protein PoB_001454800 [Plakobranchus ocellatus]
MPIKRIVHFQLAGALGKLGSFKMFPPSVTSVGGEFLTQLVVQALQWLTHKVFDLGASFSNKQTFVWVEWNSLLFLKPWMVFSAVAVVSQAFYRTEANVFAVMLSALMLTKHLVSFSYQTLQSPRKLDLKAGTVSFCWTVHGFLGVAAAGGDGERLRLAFCEAGDFESESVELFVGVFFDAEDIACLLDEALL